MAKVYEHIFKYGKYGKNICIREYDTDTKQVTFNTNIATNEFIPTLYSPKPKSGFKKSSMVTFEDDSPLWEKNFEKMGDLTKIINPEKRTDEEKELLEIQEEVGLTEAQEERLNFLRKMRSEANKKVQDEYYGNPDRVQQVIREKYPDAVKYDHDFHTIFIDIETRSGVNSNRFPEAEHALEEVTVIQMYCTKRKQFYIFGTKDWTGTYNSRFGNINYVKFRNEKDLLRGFVEFISNDYPASLFGFNAQAFDYPYLVNRIANNYKDIDYKKLSPVGEVTLNVKKKTFDDREFLGVDINGIFLLDQRDLVLKYAFLSLANYGLQDVAFAYGLKGKSSQESYEYQSFDGNYTGEGWVKLISDIDRVPDDEKMVWKLQDAKQKCMRTAPEKWTPELQKRLEQAVYNTFMDYSIRDVELMLEIEEQSKLIGIAKWIAYTCGVNITDVMGTYKQWHSYTFNDAIKDGRVLPLTQKNGDDEAVYKAGFVTAFPGIYKYVLSVDFASLFPNVFQAVNIGADTIIPEDKMPKDLLEIREKYFHFFTNENFYDTAQRKTESDAHHEERIKGKKDGKLIAKYGSDGCNDLQEERDYYVWLLNQDFSETLRKHNVSVSPNGYFYSHHKQSYTSRAMENGIKKRYEAKYKGIKLAGVVEDIKKVQAQRKEGKHPELFTDVSDEKLQSILETTIKEMEYEDSLSLALKIFINSNYGSQAMSMNAFSNGRLTGASVTITARLLIQTVANALSNEIRRFLGEEPTFDLGEIVQMDTDSAYLCLDRLIEAKLPNATEAQILQFIQNLFKSKLAPVIQNTINDIGKRLNFMKPEVLKMDQEIVSNSFVSLALKRYFARVIMSDGNVLATPKIKMTGISLVSRSTPDEVKLILKPTLDYFLNNDQAGLNKYLNDHFQDFKNIDPSRLSRPQSVASLDYKPYYDKREVKDWKIANKFARPMRDKKKSIAEGRKVMKLQTAPLNSKASIVHNHLVLEAGLEGKYELIRNADKIRIVYLKTPNPVTNNIDAIAYKDSQALKDLGVLPYVDFQTIWDKELIKKVDIIAEKVGWKIGVRTATTERADEPW